MRTGGGPYAAEFEARRDPDRKVDPAMFEGMNIVGVPKVLDVGAGPATFFGYKLNGQPIELSACDPLAPQYAKMAEDNGIAWPVATVSGFAEDLSAFYPRGTFDMVVCRNALDHSFDPVRGIEEMLLVLKVGGRVNLIHYANEAEEGSYAGFHQWNFDVVGGRPIIWNKNSHVDLIGRFGHCADISCNKIDARRLVEFRFDKKHEPELPENRAQLRIAELLLAARDAFLLRSNSNKAEKATVNRKNRKFVISAAHPQGLVVEN
ncbi:MAG TPA: class I SAM-dependent methyltransferase [Xanthobacteraceae bacterium]|nr:class I SAM-dependent methyltransferase [Xanthobacteraceae bacterium]